MTMKVVAPARTSVVSAVPRESASGMPGRSLHAPRAGGETPPSKLVGDGHPHPVVVAERAEEGAATATEHVPPKREGHPVHRLPGQGRLEHEVSLLEVDESLHAH